jgi:16S rRNA (cytidine1402-2'-O)-methyltransferase
MQVHEQFHRGALEGLAAEAEALPFKGELTVVVEGAGAPDAAPALDDTALQEQLQELMQEGVRPSQAAKIVSKRLNVPKGQVYDLAVHLAGGQLIDIDN